MRYILKNKKTVLALTLIIIMQLSVGYNYVQILTLFS